MVVDIEAGWRWLASRLFIFSVLLKEVHDLQAVVIVESNAGFQKKLLGITTPDGVQEALARCYPWFDAQLTQAANLTGVSTFRSRIHLPAALQTLEGFIDSIQVPTPPAPICRNGRKSSRGACGNIVPGSRSARLLESCPLLFTTRESRP
jgi:hypothetical protein